MIARRNRFHGYGSLRFVYQNGQTVRSPLLALKFTSNPRRADYRLAVVVSKKVNKSAVTRNRIRRRLYEVARNEAINGSYDLVLTVFSEKVASLPTNELIIDVRNLFNKAGITANSGEDAKIGGKGVIDV